VPLDFDGHGTHVAGTIGQLTNDGIGTAGVAFNVKIMPVKVLASIWDVAFGCADSDGGSDDDVARGIRYAVDNGARILNLSLGSDGPAGSAPVVEDAIRYAVRKGAFVAVAAGNSFEDGNPMQVLAEIASRVDGAVSVAAVDPQKKRAFYSSTGSFVELAAPGGSTRGSGAGSAIWQQTFDPNFTDTFLLPPARFTAPRFDVFAYVPYQGTSMATPHVTGVAAMLMQQGIVDPAVIEKALETFATDLGDPGRDPLYGFVLIEARSALRGLGIAR
jgi:serine protease